MGKVKAMLMDLEEQFWDKCEDIIKESETFQEAVGNCIKYANDNWRIVHYIHTEDEIESAVDAMWQEINA